MFGLIKVKVTKGISIFLVRKFSRFSYSCGACLLPKEFNICPIKPFVFRIPGVCLKSNFECLRIGGASSCETSLKCDLRKF